MCTPVVPTQICYTESLMIVHPDLLAECRFEVTGRHFAGDNLTRRWYALARQSHKVVLWMQHIEGPGRCGLQASPSATN